jgi:dimeric dUTPase (all-alpha-NTP-PPase superfamily)
MTHLILKYQVHVYYSRRKYANVLPRLLNLTRKKLALKVASSTMMCSARLGRDWHYLRLNEVIICQEHVVLCIHITYHPQYDQTLELTTLVLISTNNLCNQCLSVVCSIQQYVIKFVSDLRQVFRVSVSRRGSTLA